MASVYVYWDNSNIFHTAQQVAAIKDGPGDVLALRLQFENLWNLATAKRSVIKGVAVGSVPPEQKEIWRKLKSSTGVSLELYERGAQSGTEQAVDQSLQIHMLRAVLTEEEPQIAVLLTGDGAGILDSKGFFYDLQRMYNKGWGVEVVAWEASCHKGLMKWAGEVGSFVRLEDYYNSVTYIKDGRQAQPLSLVNRKKASPRMLDSQAKLKAAQEQLEAYKKKEREQAVIGVRNHGKKSPKKSK